MLTVQDHVLPILIFMTFSTTLCGFLRNKKVVQVYIQRNDLRYSSNKISRVWIEKIFLRKA